ncbi:MAG TPA: cytochrome c oxidase subunit II [Rhizomicrobium sp.]|nr:cytochrome c oxidase subunit II [Rhizomicrobium sp.]
MNQLFLFPPAASLEAKGVDQLYFVMLGLSFAILALVFGLIVVFAWRYRAGSGARRSKLPGFYAHEMEIGWTLATLLVFLGIYGWSVEARQVHWAPPHGALNVRVVAKQWMWKFEHPSGAREIDALHLPLGVPVRLDMTSQDVIHSFYVPAFREKQDVLPDRIVTLWFTPSRLGQYAIRCAEYCGTNHSLMGGEVYVVTPAEYARWADRNADRSLPAAGARSFAALGCAGCHEARADLAPRLADLYGSKVALEGNRSVLADDAYLERSILDPRADIVKGYLPIMPSYRGVATPEEVSALVAYLKTMKSGRTP